MLATSVFVCLVAAAVLVQPFPAQGQDADRQVIHVITEYKQLYLHITAVRNRLATTDFGPYFRSGNCEGFHWSLKLDSKREGPRSYSAPSIIKDGLTAAVEATLKASYGFDGAYTPVQNWLLKTLPASSNRFDVETANLLAYSEQGQTEKLASLVAQLDTDIQVMEKELQSGFLSLTKFSKDMQTAGRDAVDRDLRAQMEWLFARQEKGLRFEIQTGEDNASSDVNGPRNYGRAWPACAQKAALDSFYDYRDTYREKFNSIAAALANASGEGDNAAWMPTILAKIAEIQRRYESVRTRLKNAQVAPAGAVQELRILTAQLAVSNLAKYARGALH
jgi:hypothetical protein